MKFIKFTDTVSEVNNIIENGSKEEFLDLAKQYNLDLASGSRVYNTIVDKIKDRLLRENLIVNNLKNE